MAGEYEEMGKRLAKARKERTPHKDQESMANVLGISRSAYAQYESGRTPIQTEMLSKFCKEANIRADWVLTGEGDINEADLLSSIRQLNENNHKAIKMMIETFVAQQENDL